MPGLRRNGLLHAATRPSAMQLPPAISTENSAGDFSLLIAQLVQQQVKFVGVNRLDQVVIKACLLAVGQSFLVAVTTDCNQYQVFAAGQATQLPANFIAVLLGHADIQQHDLRPEFLQHVQRGRARCGTTHLVAFQFQQHHHAFENHRLVVHHQHLQSRSHCRWVASGG